MAGTYSVAHVRNSEIKPLTKFTFRSGPMIFGRVMTLEL